MGKERGLGNKPRIFFRDGRWHVDYARQGMNKHTKYWYRAATYFCRRQRFKTRNEMIAKYLQNLS